MALARQKEEVAEKARRIAAFIERHELDGLALARQTNFAWASGGSTSWVSTASELGVATLLFNKDGSRYAVMPNIETPRLTDEEHLSELGFEIVPTNWWEGDMSRDRALFRAAGGPDMRLGTDWPLAGWRCSELTGLIAHERFSLTPQECERYRQVGATAAGVLEKVVANLEPGLTEWEIAGRLSAETLGLGLVPFVTLVAVDERIYQYRHPIPTFKKLDKYAMVVLCARGGGLVANCTRLVHFGPLSPELREKQAATQRLNALFNLATRPGVPVREILAQVQQEYARAGYPNEWQLHHQGGGCGYESRDYLGVPSSDEVVQNWQAFAWNPSITGIKTEDTVLVSEGRPPEVLTRPAASTWPLDAVTIEGLGTLACPAILVKD